MNDATAIVFLTTPDNPSGFAPHVDDLLDFHHRLRDDCLLRIKLPFSVNVIAETAGIAALGDDSFRADTIKTVVQEREILAHTLGDMGFRVYPSQANFVLVRPPIAASQLFEELLRRGVIVRPLSSYGLDDYLRISVGNFEDNETLLTAVHEILAR